MKVKHVTLAEYLSGHEVEKVSYNLKYGSFKPVDLFDVGDLFECKFGFVKDLQEACNYIGLTYDKLCSILVPYGYITEKEFYNISVYKIQEAIKFFIEGIEQINKIESEQLGSEPTPEEEQANIGRFKKYRTFLQKDAATKF